MSNRVLAAVIAIGAVATAAVGYVIYRRRAVGAAPSSSSASFSGAATGGGATRAAATIGVAPAIAQLRHDLDAAFPARSKASDGGLPGAAHHEHNPNSDHERGDAFDITHDAANGPDLDALADALLADARTTYVIWNRRIANKAIEGGAWRPYAATAIQTDPHTSHLHVSIAHDQRDNAFPWDLSGVGRSGVA